MRYKVIELCSQDIEHKIIKNILRRGYDIEGIYCKR